jgi:biopolymer transport protein TolR
MARTFRRPRSSHPIADLNVTNLIDLGFMLLIIFMIVANPTLQKEQTIPIDLPTVSKMQQPPADPRDRFMTVGVNAKGQFFVDNRNVAVTMTELRQRLNEEARKPHPAVIRIQGDKRASLQPFAEVLNEVEKAGLTRISFDSTSVE